MLQPLPIPHFRHENRLLRQRSDGCTVCGVDEAGRGPLAGPVVAAAVIIPFAVRRRSWVRDLRDSKLLPAEKRADLYARITDHCLWGVGQASSMEIDAINILQATFLAMRRAVAVLAPHETLQGELVSLIDGNRAPPGLPGESVTLIKGDQSSCSIAAASILAKVTRDRIMTQMCRDYPVYGFSRHVGYGTPQHLAALAAHGPCPEHRRSFAPVKILSSS